MPKLRFQMSEVVEQVSHIVSTLIDFTVTGYFHKLYLSGKPYSFINYFSSLCICKETFVVVVVVVVVRSEEHISSFSDRVLKSEI